MHNLFGFNPLNLNPFQAIGFKYQQIAVPLAGRLDYIPPEVALCGCVRSILKMLAWMENVTSYYNATSYCMVKTLVCVYKNQSKMRGKKSKFRPALLH